MHKIFFQLFAISARSKLFTVVKLNYTPLQKIIYDSMSFSVV
ncbi:hypothetical protein FORMB_16540 [Formosa sp. Hel1_33_131]|nr:hypothetical protein FORMB_16540 [Formosa sp. Hel1_33_131]